MSNKHLPTRDTACDMTGHLQRLVLVATSEVNEELSHKRIAGGDSCRQIGDF